MSSTRLSAYCSKIIEAGWIAAMVLVPLYFNVYSSRVFEPDKLTLLRSIAIFMSAAWIIKGIEERSHGQQVLRFSWRTPLVLPTLVLIAVYLFSTLTSVAPFTSLWGSYQRLQGTYTTLAYIVVFFLILNEMRSREQLDRLITIAIITSVPISLYGLIQHYGIDPLPWGGDVTKRVASNMGNAIFISAYEIMIFFLTLGRIVESFIAILTEEEDFIADILRAAAYIFVALIQLITIWFSQSRGPLMGLLAGSFTFVLFGLLALRNAAPDRGPMTSSDVARATGASLLLAVVGAIAGLGLVSGANAAGLITDVTLSTLRSAGLLVGATVGGAVLSLLLVAFRRTWKWFWMVWVAEALLVVGFFVLFNLPSSPISSLRDLPYIGRLGKVFQTEGGTGKVRVLIWEGAVEMITPHDALGYPPTSPEDPFENDKLNLLRPLIGYGPESMYVAYNPFYPPDLAHYEKRNASPDRSHNETFDALVITGVVGLIAYMILFSSVFYYGLKWLGWINDQRERNIWLGLFLAGGVLGAAGLMLWQGVNFFGVGFPFGMVAGLVLYLIIYASFLYKAPVQGDKAPVQGDKAPVQGDKAPVQGDKASDEQEPEDKAIIGSREILLVALVSTVLAHFVEIHFGIAIAATRTYFWICAALMVLLGRNMLAEKAETEPATESIPASETPTPASTSRKARRKKRRQQQRRTAPPPRSRALGMPAWLSPMLVSALALTLIMGTLGFDFVTNSSHTAVELNECNPQGGRMLVSCWTSKAWEIVKHDLTVLPARGRSRPEETKSLMTLGLLGLTLMIGSVLTVSESRLGRDVLRERWQRWAKMMPVLALDALFMLLFVLLFLLAPPARDWLGKQKPSNWWWLALLFMMASSLLALLVWYIKDRLDEEQAENWEQVALIHVSDAVIKLMLVLFVHSAGWPQDSSASGWLWMMLVLVGVAAYAAMLVLDFIRWLQEPQGKYWLLEMIVVVAVLVTLVVLLFIADRHLRLGVLQMTRSQTSLVELIRDLLNVSMYLSSVLDAFYYFVFLMILAIGLALLLGKRLPKIWASPGGAIATLPLFILALFIMNQTNLKVIRADVVYKQGEEWSRQQQWDLAIAHHKRALEMAPNEDFYYLWAGSAYLEKSKSAPIEGCILQDPNISGILSMSVERTAQLCRQDLLIAARTILLQARRVNPLNTDHTANLGRLYKNWADLDKGNKQGYIDTSVGYYTQATLLSPQNTIIWNELATVYLYQLRDLVKARETIQKSLSLDDRFEQTYMILGDSWIREAEPFFNQLAQKQAELSAAQDDAARSAIQDEISDLQAQRDAALESAIAAYEQALEITPRTMNVYTTIASAYEQMGRLEEAIQTFDDAALANPTSAEPHIGLAQFYQRRNQPDMALAEYRQAVNLAPRNANYRLTLASLLEGMGRIEDALVELRAAADLKPEDPALRQNLAFMYQQLQMYPEALAEAQTAAQLAPADPTSQLLIGDLSRTMNDIPTAAAAYEQALLLNPNLDNAWNVHLNLALLYQETEQLDLSLLHAQAALPAAPEAQQSQISDFIAHLESLNP